MPIRLPYRGFIFDLDGTVYLGEQLLPGAKTAIAALRDAGRQVCFLSNKPIQSRADYAEKLARLGIPARVEEVINSSYVLGRYLGRTAPGARCFVIGEPPLVDELRAAGLTPVDDARVDYVVVAFDRTFDYRKLDVALQAVKRHGARLIGTNPDRTCPAEGGEIPDAAGMIGAVEGVTGPRPASHRGSGLGPVPWPALSFGTRSRAGVSGSVPAPELPTPTRSGVVE